MTETQDDNVQHYVKEAFRGLKPLKPSQKDSISVYKDVMSERMQMTVEMDKKRIEFDRQRHDEDIEVKRRRNDIEMLKVNKILV